MKRIFFAPLLLLVSASLIAAPAQSSDLPDLSVLEQAKLTPLNKAARESAAKEAKVTVVVMWASWCDFCRDQLHRLRALHRAHEGKGLRIIGISIEDSEAEAKAEADKQDYPFAVAHDAEKKVKNALGIGKIPDTYILDSAKKTRAVYRGMSNDRYTYMQKRILSMLGQAEDE